MIIIAVNQLKSHFPQPFLVDREADEHVSPADVHTSQPEESGPDEPGLDTEAEK